MVTVEPLNVTCEVSVADMDATVVLPLLTIKLPEPALTDSLKRRTKSLPIATLVAPPTETLSKLMFVNIGAVMSAGGCGVTDVSKILTEADLPCTVTVMVSVPSVRLSARTGSEIVAWPLAPMVTLPERLPLVRSDEEIPETVYARLVLAATLVVETVKVAVAPSLTELEAEVMA